MKKAFTLIELMIVMVIVVMIIGVGLGGMINSQRQVLFLSAYENVIQLVRDQRSLALSGKAMPDYTDYDKDLSSVDLVTPANYGVSFDLTKKTVTTFIDLHKSATITNQTEGQYDPPYSPPATTTLVFYQYVPGKDVAMAQYKLDSKLGLISNMFKTGNTRVDIFYSPIFGDVTIKPALTAPEQFLIFGVEDHDKGRVKCSKIHPIAGVPEGATEAECVNPT